MSSQSTFFFTPCIFTFIYITGDFAPEVGPISFNNFFLVAIPKFGVIKKCLHMKFDQNLSTRMYRQQTTDVRQAERTSFQNNFLIGFIRKTLNIYISTHHITTQHNATYIFVFLLEPYFTNFKSTYMMLYL